VHKKGLERSGPRSQHEEGAPSRVKEKDAKKRVRKKRSWSKGKRGEEKGGQCLFTRTGRLGPKQNDPEGETQKGTILQKYHRIGGGGGMLTLPIWPKPGEQRVLKRAKLGREAEAIWGQPGLTVIPIKQGIIKKREFPL